MQRNLQLMYSVISKKCCAMCEWEQQCSDNPLLFDPKFARQYIKECQSWLINKQSVCAKCKLQLGQHIVDNQAQNDAPASNSIHQQRHHFNQKCESSEKDAFPFQELNSKELIEVQSSLRKSKNLINTQNTDTNEKFNQEHTRKNLIDTKDNEIFLINKELRVPLLHIANKLLGRQNLNFDQSIPPEQQLWNLFEKSDIYEFLTSEKDTTPEFRHNCITCSAKPRVTFDCQGFLNDWAQANQHLYQPPPVQRTQSAPSQVQHFLRERKNKINYGALHLGQELQQVSHELKEKCKLMRKSVRKSAKAAITKLVPGAFSPKPAAPATAPSLPVTMSSSSWKFWPSK
jgi:hypothetical protein